LYLRDVDADVGGRHVHGFVGADIDIRIQVVLRLLAAKVCQDRFLLLRIWVLDVEERHKVRHNLLIQVLPWIKLD
jgi:hypothetical protein